MLCRVSSTHFRTSIVNQVCSFLAFLSPLRYRLYTLSTSVSPPSSSNSSLKLSNTHLESPLFNVPLVGNSVISKYFSSCSHKVDNFTTSNASLNELLLRISHMSPATTRKFLRVSSLKSEDVLEILLGFQLGSENRSHDARIIESLHEIFERAADNNEGFKHLPKSCEVMASMLISAGMLREVESLLSTMESKGLSLASDEIFSSLIEGYVNSSDLERALLMYDHMKRRNLAPSLTCYRALLDLLVKEHETSHACRIYEDFLEVGFEFGHVESRFLEILMGFLCQDGKIKEARKLLKKIVASGWKPSTVVLSKVADVYCDKKDFEDILNFFVEIKCTPDVEVGNKIVFSLCSNFGLERACLFLLELEHSGFIPNEITFGIFICWSCLEGKLKDAFVYMSEILSRGLKPDRRSYNALVSGLFMAGLQEHAREIVNEMIDNGVKPDLATFRALLAGYSKSRQFSEVKLVITEMVNYGLTSVSPLEDPISKAFSILGLDPLTVKVKRDNDVKSFRTEFVDELGNGLYLDTNLDVFEKTVISVLEESLFPDFNLLVMNQCCVKNAKAALIMVDEMFQWGQELSLPTLSKLVRLLCESKNYIKTIPRLLDKIPRLVSQLDHETLDFLLRTLGKMGCTNKCRSLTAESFPARKIIDKGIIPEIIDYNSLILEFSRYGKLEAAVNLLDRMLKKQITPDLASYDCIVQSFCAHNHLDRAMDFFNEMLVRNLKPSIGTWDVVLEKLCVTEQTVEAERLLNLMVDNGGTPTKEMFSYVINRHQFEKNLSKASELLQKMQQHGYEPDFMTQWSLISSTLRSNSSDREGGSNTQGGFLSKLLLQSGFPSEGGTKCSRG